MNKFLALITSADNPTAKITSGLVLLSAVVGYLMENPFPPKSASEWILVAAGVLKIIADFTRQKPQD